MKRPNYTQLFSVTILVLIIMSLNLQPAIAITRDSLSRSDEEAAIEAQIDAYIKLKYETMHTLVPQDFSSLVGDSREAKSFLQSEMEKRKIELYHARLNQLRYIQYDYSLSIQDIVFNPSLDRAVVKLIENHDIVFEISAPIVSSMRNLSHEIKLEKQQGKWRIVDDFYEDYLWQLLNTTQMTQEEMFQVIEQKSIERSNIEVSRPVKDYNPGNMILGSYNRVGAVTYAHSWAYNRNSAYYDFSVLGGDCTNFVSQAMYEGGGIPQTPSAGQVGGPGWYYVNINDRAAAWTDVNSLYDFLINGHFWDGGPEGLVKPSESYMYEGDIIQYNWDGGSVWDHSVIVVQPIQLTPPYPIWYPLVAGHSPDVDYYPFSSFDYNNVRFLHITGY